MKTWKNDYTLIPHHVDSSPYFFSGSPRSNFGARRTDLFVYGSGDNQGWSRFCGNVRDGRIPFDRLSLPYLSPHLTASVEPSAIPSSTSFAWIPFN